MILPESATQIVITSAVVFVLSAAGAVLAYRPVKEIIRRQEHLYATILQKKLLLNISPRMVTILTLVGMGLLALIGMQVANSGMGALLGAAVGMVIPTVALHALRKRHLHRLEKQLVGGIHTLTSGVRAGLNLVQSLGLLARDGPTPLKHEVAHLLREYEYGVPLEEAMDNSALRIGSSDYRLLFAALQTHRHRGGDLGETLERIGNSIREIQRLENRVKTLTAEGRATSRWLGAMPIVVIGIYYFMIDPAGLEAMFADGLGKLLIMLVLLLNVLGFVWIRKIMSVDI
jgi:tight adherence protein B